MAKVHVGVGFEEVDQSLTGVSTGANQGDAGRDVIRGVLLVERGVGTYAAVVADEQDPVLGSPLNSANNLNATSPFLRNMDGDNDEQGARAAGWDAAAEFDGLPWWQVPSVRASFPASYAASF
ncbi:hypothetical protein HYQ46_004476 [Verticillium longisporum]|nr:hypothetical protein HYQ46_004476 [Verticillium longisporum]